MRRSDDKFFETAHLSVGLRRRSVAGALGMLAAQVVKFLIQTVGTITLARLLTPQDFGLVGMVAALTGFILLFNDLGLAAAIIQSEHIDQLQVSTLFWTNVGVSAFFAGITVLLSPLVAAFYDEPRLTYITAISGVGFLVAGLSVQHQALLKRQMRFDMLRLIDVVSATLGVAAAFVAVALDQGYWSLVIMPLTATLALTIGSWVGCGWRPSFQFDFKAAKGMLRVGRDLTGFNSMNYFSRNADNVLIGRFWGAQALGLYSNAYKLVLLPIQQIIGPLSSVAVPALSRLQNRPQQYREAYNHLVALLSVITVPIGVFVIVGGDLIVRVVLGGEWAGAGIILQCLGLTIISQPIGSTTGWLFISQDRSRDMLRWGGIGTVLSVASILIGLPWGALGVAFSYSVLGVVLREPLLFWFISLKGPIRQSDFYAPLLLVLLPAVISTFLLVSIRNYAGLNPSAALAAMFSALVVVFVTWVVSPFGKKGRQHINWLYESIKSNRKQKQPVNG